MAVLQSVPLSVTPPAIGQKLYRAVHSAVQVDDPYLNVKQASTRLALDLYPYLASLVARAEDPLERAVRLAIAGNQLDYGPPNLPVSPASLRAAVDRALEQPLAIDHLGLFRKRLAESDHFLYLADNAGETVFDRLLIETMAKPTTYVVKGAPVLNDATIEDALAADLDHVACVIDNGSDAPGTILGECSAAVREEFESARLVVAKGQANYETLNDCGREVFHLLQVKCSVIASDAGVPVGSMVIGRTAMAQPRKKGAWVC